MGAIFDASGRVMLRPEWKQYFENFTTPFAFFDPDEYRPLLIEAGFSIKRLEFIPKTMVQKGRAGLTGAVGNMWQPYLESYIFVKPDVAKLYYRSMYGECVTESDGEVYIVSSPFTHDLGIIIRLKKTEDQIKNYNFSDFNACL